MPSRASAVLALGLLVAGACSAPLPPVREPRRTRRPLPPRADPAPRQRERAAVWSLSTSADLESFGSGRRFQVVTTDSFRLLHLDAPQARRLADEAERRRRELVATWIGAEAAQAAWRPRCEITLYATKQQLGLMSGAARSVGLAHARRAELTPGSILARRIQLAADDPELYAGTLPHEIAHIVLRDALQGQLGPLWATEGMAQLCEAPELQQRYQRFFARALAAGRALPLGELLTLREYPAERTKHLFYAESHSLAAFLVARSGPRAFVAFLRDAVRGDPLRALQRAYGFASIRALTSDWHRAASLAAGAAAAGRCATSRRSGSLSKESIQRVIHGEFHRIIAPAVWPATGRGLPPGACGGAVVARAIAIAPAVWPARPCGSQPL